MSALVGDEPFLICPGSHEGFEGSVVPSELLRDGPESFFVLRKMPSHQVVLRDSTHEASALKEETEHLEDFVFVHATLLLLVVAPRG